MDQQKVQQQQQSPLDGDKNRETSYDENNANILTNMMEPPTTGQCTASSSNSLPVAPVSTENLSDNMSLMTINNPALSENLPSPSVDDTASSGQMINQLESTDAPSVLEQSVQHSSTENLSSGLRRISSNTSMNEQVRSSDEENTLTLDQQHLSDEDVQSELPGPSVPSEFTQPDLSEPSDYLSELVNEYSYGPDDELILMLHQSVNCRLMCPSKYIKGRITGKLPHNRFRLVPFLPY